MNNFEFKERSMWMETEEPFKALVEQSEATAQKAIELIEELKPVVVIFPETSTILLPDQCFDCGKHPEGFCMMYKGKEDRQHSRVGGCAGRTHDREIVIDKNGKDINPLKASKRKMAGVK